MNNDRTSPTQPRNDRAEGPAPRRHIAGGLLVLLLCLFAQHLRAENNPPLQEQILQQELQQQQIKTTVQRVGDQLGSIIAEFEQNEISGEDVKVLKAIRRVLGHLTAQEMEQIIALLQKARHPGDDAASRQGVADAYSGQKTVITQLRQLLLEYDRQQALYGLSLRLKELSSRQAVNLRLSLGLSKATAQKSLEAFEEAHKLNLLVQQKDQESLKEETVLILARLERMSKEINDGPNSDRPKAALRQAQDGGLLPALQKAVEDLKHGRLDSAAGHEKTARDQLREAARLLTFSLDPAEALRQALHAVDQTIDQQKLLTQDTRKIETKETGAQAESRQIELVDATDLIRQDVESLAPVASEHLKNSREKMQEARAVLSSESRPKEKSEKAPVKQGEAVAHLEQARRVLQDELTKAEQQAAQPKENAPGLQELQEQVRELIKQEDKLRQETSATASKDLLSHAPRQGELKDATQELQQRMATQVPTAAQALGEAAHQMQSAQTSLARQQNASSSQQAALEALQTAEQRLSQELDKLDKAQKELAALEELQQKLQIVIEQQQSVQLATAKEALQPAPAQLRPLASRQAQLGTDTATLQQRASGPAPAAAVHLSHALERMSEAKDALEKTEPKTAQSQQTDALADLYQAKKELDHKLDGLKGDTGRKPKPNPEALADAAAIIRRAQKEVSDALSEMQRSPENFVESLTLQQREIAETLAHMSEFAPAVKTVDTARKVAQTAANNLAQPNLPFAVASMRATQSALQNATKAARAGENPEPAALQDLARRQTRIKEMVEKLIESQKTAPAGALPRAARLMEQAAGEVGPLAAGKVPGLPASAKTALQSATSALANGAAQASAGQSQPAQGNAGTAAEALARAQAALAMAQAGLGSDAPSAGAGQSKGQGQSPGQGQAQGQGNGPGQGKGQGQAKGTPGQQGSGNANNAAGSGNADGPRGNVEGTGQFTGLPKRDRAALRQSQGEKYPQEYGPLVEQYLKNLSDNAGGK